MLSRFPRAWALMFSVAIFVSAVASAQVAVSNWHYDNAGSGANPNETILTPQNVNSTQFGKLFTQPVDGLVIGQALYLPAVTIAGKGLHNVLYVATMHDSVYAFDADSATGNNTQPLWRTSFLKSGVTTIPIEKQGCGGTTKWTEVGIVSTPVIDPVAGSLYVVAKTYEHSKYVHRLHVLNVATGKEQAGSPVVIAASYLYNGEQISFADAMQVNRPALLLENGNLYIAFGSNGCRGGLEEGWVLAYNATTLQPQGAFDVEPNDSAAAIWQRGGGLTSDSEGNIYGATADGDFASGTNFGQSVLKLSQVGAALNLADWFTPYNEADLDHQDLDMSEPVLILPDQTGSHPHLAAAIGKEGTIYLLNRDNMGHFCATCTSKDSQIVQEMVAVAPETGALMYWNNAIYTSGAGLPITALALTKGKLSGTPIAKTKQTTNGHSPVISANGTSSGIVWQLTGEYMFAFDATTLAKLYTTSQASNDRDELPATPHFANLVVANGKVYVGTNNSVVAYGLF